MKMSGRWSFLHLLICVAAAMAQATSAYDASGGTGNLVTYWGENGDEGSLAEVCQTSLYDMVILSYLDLSGSPPEEPYLHLDAHCNSTAGNCTLLSSDIATCQSLNVRVLLSISGGGSGFDAQYVAAYLWNAFLSGAMGAEERPLGPAILDGIDMDVGDEEEGAAPYLGVLAQTVRQLSAGGAILSAAPGCTFPDASLGPELPGSALDADGGGAFDYVWVRFYDSPACEYGGGGDTSALLGAWEQWTQALPEAKVLLGIPASMSDTGFIPADTLLRDVLPLVEDSINYGGVLLRRPNATYAAALKPGL